jgi:hypothetical protein
MAAAAVAAVLAAVAVSIAVQLMAIVALRQHQYHHWTGAGMVYTSYR